MLEGQQTRPRARRVGADAPILSPHARQNMEPATVARAIGVNRAIGAPALPIRFEVSGQFLGDRPQPPMALKSGREA